MTRRLRAGFCFAAFLGLLGSPTRAADLVVNLVNAPDQGRLVFQLFDSANAFGDFRDPAREVVFESTPTGEYRLTDLSSGIVALLVYFDENSNGFLDRNFIGIPVEALGLSNNYRPKGPPSFDRAAFELVDGTELSIDIELYRILGRRGRIGIGLGAIGRSSPYSDSSEEVVQVIPAITYSGDRLQWLGPSVRYGILGRGDLRLAILASYRIGVYEEQDSPILAGLGDREGTLMAGLGLQAELPGGFELGLVYEHDALDRIGGGLARVELAKGFQIGNARLQPQVALNWLSAELGNHDFGVAIDAARSDRPAYELGDTLSAELGLGSFVELTENWLAVVNASVEILEDEVSQSPIVDDDRIFKTFAAIVFLF